MTHYRNIGGNSGVLAFESTADSITVQFNNGSAYIYTYAIPGKSDVDRMKLLAENGSGLNSYISSVIKKRYQTKLR